MSRTVLQVLEAIASIWLLILSPCAVAQVGNFCPAGGPCNFTDVTLVNVYWDVSPASWDADVGGPGSGRTQAQIDAFTAGLVHSSYFNQLGQYGVKSVAVAPSLTTGACGSVPANVDAGISQIESLILCALTHAQVTATPQVIINIFLPPRVINTGFCNPDASGSFASAFHGHSSTFSSPLYTFVPTTAACNGGATATFASLTHEIVEALTDPDPEALSGWKVPADGEIADLCENLTAFPVSPYANGFAQQYWSNSARACVVGFAASPAPTGTSSAVCGAGQNMRITLNGIFGPTPWDLVSNAFARQSLYLSATINSPGKSPWQAGNFLGPSPTVGFQRILWTVGTGPGGSDQIEVTGFNGAYGAPAFNVRPGDTIAFTITNPVNGASSTTAVTVPFPSSLSLVVAPDILPAAVGNIDVRAVDQNACGYENVVVTLSDSAGVPLNPITTGPGGSRSLGFRYPPIAGPVTFNANTAIANGVMVIASATTRVLPGIDRFVGEAVGPVAGGQTVAIQGVGFDATTTVAFNGNIVPVQTTAPDHHTVSLRTPPATPTGSSGVVNVTATVHGLTTAAIPYDYVVPDVPVMTFLGGVGSSSATHSCETGRIRVAAYDATGALEAVSISLSANYPALYSGSQLAQTLLIPSGSEVTISGGGPITATNQSVPSAIAVQGFPIWPADLCASISIVTAKVNHLIPKKAATWTVSEPTCTEGCGNPGIQTVLWSDSNDFTRARNALWVQGPGAAALKESLEVVELDEGAQQRLVTQHSALGMRTKSARRAEFVGPMIEIRSRGGEAMSARVRQSAHITFARPDSAERDAYAIVHLLNAGNVLGWIEEKPTVSDRHGAILTTAIEVTGVYGLVRLDTRAEKTSRARIAPAKK